MGGQGKGEAGMAAVGGAGGGQLAVVGGGGVEEGADRNNVMTHAH